MVLSKLLSNGFHITRLSQQQTHRITFVGIRTLSSENMRSRAKLSSQPVAVDTFPPTPFVAPQPPKDLDLKRTGRIIGSLTKMRLGSLVLLTTMGGFVLAPATISLSSLPLFAATTLGTGLCIASANTINQVIEVKQDAIMRRTCNRPIPSGNLSRGTALTMGLMFGASGFSILSMFVNPLTACLGLANIVLYTCVYTPMKQMHYLNTWVGAIVGAIPPIMGWAAITGSLSPGAWVLFGLLFTWQIPHFLALSWMAKDDYSAAGYRMLVCDDPLRVPSTSLVYSAALLPVGPLCWAVGMTSPWFIVDATALTLWFMFDAWGFYRDPSRDSARRLFFGSIKYLPLLMGAMWFHKVTDQDDKNTDTDGKNDDTRLQLRSSSQ